MKRAIIYTIKAAFISLMIFSLALMLTEMSTAGPRYTLVYVVQEGDTLSGIASKYGVSTRELRESNDLERDSLIKLGQDLIIPEPDNNPGADFHQRLFTGSPDRGAVQYSLDIGSNYQVRVNPGHALPEVNIPRDKIITYHVGLGDTLYDLAKELNTSIGVIMALNGMESSVIRIGQKIKIPINNLTPRQVLARTINDRDLELLARAIHGEARGEPFLGQVAVGAVIINRVISDYFPDTFSEVIFQKRQFSAVADGQFRLTPGRTAYRAARSALAGNDPTMGALYYYNPKTAKNQWWFKTRPLLVTIGEHIFTK